MKDTGVPPAFATSLETFLRPEALAPLAQPETAAALAQGKLLVIHDALPAALAEQMFQCLDQFTDWKLRQSYAPTRGSPMTGGGGFHFHHHNIDDDQFPVALRMCREIFCSPASTAFIERLSGQTCRKATSFSASWYRPGDHSTPHNDNVRKRKVAFVWHLTKDWDPEHGGALFWAPSGRYLPASFNTLYLFNVTETSHHCVTQVSALATSKRFAINGWWGGSEGHEAAPVEIGSEVGGPIQWI